MKNSLRCVSSCIVISSPASEGQPHLMLGAVDLPLQLPEQLLEPDRVPDLLLRHVSASLGGAEVEAAVVTLGVVQTPGYGDRVRGH